MLYWHKPTRWECQEHKRGFVGRPVMDGVGSWNFLAEEEFHKRQSETEQLLAERKRALRPESPTY